MHTWKYGLVQYAADAGGSGGTGTEPTPPTGDPTPPSPNDAPGTEPTDGGKPTPPAEDIEKKIADAIAAAKQQWEEDAVEKARVAKLSAEERTKEEAAKLDRDRAAFERKQLIFDASQQLSTAKLPVDFAETLVGKTADETKANIATFASAFKTAVEAAVTERLKGTPPQAGGKPGDPNAADAKYKNNPYYGKPI